MISICTSILYLYYVPWASTTIKINVDPISMIKTPRYAMVVILTRGWNPRVHIQLKHPGSCPSMNIWPEGLWNLQQHALIYNVIYIFEGDSNNDGHLACHCGENSGIFF